MVGDERRPRPETEAAGRITAGRHFLGHLAGVTTERRADAHRVLSVSAPDARRIAAEDREVAGFHCLRATSALEHRAERTFSLDVSAMAITQPGSEFSSDSRGAPVSWDFKGGK